MLDFPCWGLTRWRHSGFLHLAVPGCRSRRCARRWESHCWCHQPSSPLVGTHLWMCSSSMEQPPLGCPHKWQSLRPRFLIGRTTLQVEIQAAASKNVLFNIKGVTTGASSTRSKMPQPHDIQYSSSTSLLDHFRWGQRFSQLTSALAGIVPDQVSPGALQRAWRWR